MKIKRYRLTVLVVLLISQTTLLAQKHFTQAVPFNQINIHDRFWTPRLEAHAHHTLETCIAQTQDSTERINNLKKPPD